MEKIIPRWEWRTFGKDLGDGEKNIAAHPVEKVRESKEVYILSAVSRDNTKIRDGLMDIKILKNVNENQLEQWMPILKAEFPLTVETLKEVYQSFKVPLPDFQREAYTFEQFLQELIQPNPQLKAVDVHKKRMGYTINDCIVEIAEVIANREALRTVAVEHADPELVMRTVRELGLDRFENINYLKALKNVVGLPY